MPDSILLLIWSLVLLPLILLLLYLILFIYHISDTSYFHLKGIFQHPGTIISFILIIIFCSVSLVISFFQNHLTMKLIVFNTLIIISFFLILGHRNNLIEFTDIFWKEYLNYDVYFKYRHRKKQQKNTQILGYRELYLPKLKNNIGIKHVWEYIEKRKVQKIKKQYNRYLKSTRIQKIKNMMGIDIRQRYINYIFRAAQLFDEKPALKMLKVIRGKKKPYSIRKMLGLSTSLDRWKQYIELQHTLKFVKETVPRRKAFKDQTSLYLILDDLKSSIKNKNQNEFVEKIQVYGWLQNKIDHYNWLRLMYSPISILSLISIIFSLFVIISNEDISSYLIIKSTFISIFFYICLLSAFTAARILHTSQWDVIDISMGDNKDDEDRFFRKLSKIGDYHGLMTGVVLGIGFPIFITDYIVVGMSNLEDIPNAIMNIFLSSTGILFAGLILFIFLVFFLPVLGGHIIIINSKKISIRLLKRIFKTNDVTVDNDTRLKQIINQGKIQSIRDMPEWLVDFSLGARTLISLLLPIITSLSKTAITELLK